MGVGKTGVGEMGVGEMGVGETVPTCVMYQLNCDTCLCSSL